MLHSNVDFFQYLFSLVTGLSFDIIKALDINDLANFVYNSNFIGTHACNRTIEVSPF